MALGLASALRVWAVFEQIVFQTSAVVSNVNISAMPAADNMNKSTKRNLPLIHRDSEFIEQQHNWSIEELYEINQINIWKIMNNNFYPFPFPFPFH